MPDASAARPCRTASLDALGLRPAVRDALADARAALDRLYGARLAGLVLYGSQARGDARPDSDVDVLVLLHGEVEVVAEAWRTSGLVMDIAAEHDVALSLVHARAEDFARRDRTFYRHIARDGVALT
jgi:predicted nucleotidyltransferase